MAALVLNGDALEVLRTIPDASVDACVTDPPAGIAFMGKSWDDPSRYGFAGERLGGPPGVNLARNPTCAGCGGRKRAGPKTRGCECAEPRWNDIDLRLRDREAFQAMLRPVFVEVLRTLKPGAHALVWALPRTSHWTATAVEDAGFEIRDVGVHLFGTGFPKSLNVSKAIDDAAGAERPVVGANPNHRPVSGVEYEGVYAGGNTGAANITAPATPEAAQWDGWGTALKPAAEHWILARKPLIGTVAANVLAHGTGALNVDGCRIEGAPRAPGTKTPGNGQGGGASLRGSGRDRQMEYAAQIAAGEILGRWPANVTLDEEAATELDAQSGDRPGMSGGGKHRSDATPGMFGAIDGNTSHVRADSGGASRFFYVAKPSTREREAGCEGLPRRSAGELVDREEGSAGMSNPRAGAGRTSKGRANHHPTVKSIALMRWLVRLVTPPGGLVLDPFCGSGSTGCAAVLEGASFIGIEQDPEFVAIAEARIKHHVP